MEMKYEPGSEKVAMMSGTYPQTTKILTLAEDPNVQRPRKILLIIFGVFLALCLINTTVGIVDVARNSTGSAFIIVSLISIVINGLGFWSTYKYNATGLRVKLSAYLSNSLYYELNEHKIYDRGVIVPIVIRTICTPFLNELKREGIL
ncbi:unnamed protein product [Rotaria sp. Silwood1]|nr:unnamed protein product [Rotaria sp. Silwood1]